MLAVSEIAHLKSYYNVMVTKTVWYLLKNGSVNQGDQREVTLRHSSYLSFDKGVKNIPWRKETL